jgi:hypothetical protein
MTRTYKFSKHLQTAQFWIFTPVDPAEFVSIADFVVDVKVGHGAASLTFPAITFQHFLVTSPGGLSGLGFSWR